ncbi:MAG: DUF11 domain-containing protein [Limnohabitans sp.]|uniref:beta strand repeat-containing protein n=1 Tax=Limnohabitans sp. TaxID=1907725 RepID=UPI0025D822F4|nr:hypothetical protein [Limnohabitans sp.]MCO4087614.1 DUF11 domain-containing protein [Limnohabitans sp.]
MAQKITTGKNPSSRNALDDEGNSGNNSLYGQVNALASPDSNSPWFLSKTNKLLGNLDVSQSESKAFNASASLDSPARTGDPISSKVDKVYQHWADGDAASGTKAEWNNNILSDSKSDYFEGEVVPHVFYYTASNSQPLVNGQSYSFNVTYNYYQANTNAGGFLFMTSPDVDRDPTNFAGIATTEDVIFDNGGGTLGNFQTVNANITDVSQVTYTTTVGGTMDGQVTITFIYTGSTTKTGGAEIQYGLMIANPGAVPDQGSGPTLGATAWTGGSLQTTVDIGGKGAMSLQLMTSAIIDGEISGMKFNDMDGNGARDADGIDNVAGTADDEVGMASWTIFLDKDADGVLDAGERSTITDAQGRYSFSVTPDADPTDPDNDAYVVREVQQTGWVQTTLNPLGIVITAMSPKFMDVDFGNQQLMPALNIVKDATVPGGTANVAGEVISYTITVQNTGNQMLTGVTVADPMISDLTLVPNAASSDGELDVGETWTWTGTHVVTQAEIDAGTPIVNLATADSNQTDPDTDDASVAVEQSASLNIVKDASVTGGTANAAGEVIDYTISVQNTGNQTLTGVLVSDPFISNLTLVADAASADGELDVGETWSYTASHVVTQAEIDAGTPIVNLATADSEQTGPDTDDASVAVEQSASLNIVKDASVTGGTANAAGEVINYTIAVSNTGNQTLTGVLVSDPFISNLALVADAASADGELDVGETWSYTASHVVTQAEIDAGTPIVNLATADSDQSGPDTDDASVAVEQAPFIAVDKAIASITGGNGNIAADAPGDLLNYTITVSNPGNMTLTDVTITDVLTGMNVVGVTLSPGQSQTYLTSYTLTQQDLDSNGGGDGYVENTATADSAQTGPVSDIEPIQLLPRPSLSLNKALVSVTGGNGNTILDAAGDVLLYNVTVANEGNITLTGVSVLDPSTGLNVTGLTLEPGETAVLNSSYTLTQADVDSNGDGDGYHDNTATADSDQTAALSDTESSPLLRTIGLGVEKNVTGVTGGNNNGFADQASEILNYSINVFNAGTVTLTNVTVYDDLTGLSQTIASLAPGANQNYLTSYTLTQDDLDSNGGGNGYIENSTTVDSDQTEPTQDNETVQLIRTPVLFLDKTFLNVTGGNGNNLVDAVGDLLNYRIVVANPSNVTLTDVSVNEPLTGLNVAGLTLIPGQTQTYLTSYTLTQADLDNNGGGDGYIDNIAIADSAQTTPISDIESVPILRSIGMAFDKRIVSINGGNGNSLADAAGDVLNYVFTVKNEGSVTLTNLTVVDDLNGMSESLASLAPGATVVYNSSYVLTQADLDSNAGGDGVLTNTAIADTNETPSFVDAEGVTVVYQPGIDLTKYVSVDNGVTWLDANTETGPVLSSSLDIDPQFRYTVSNTGNITLADVTLTDAVYDLNGAAAGTSYSFGNLAVGASAEFIFTDAAWAAGQQSGDAAVAVASMPLVLDIDNAYYLGV